MIDGRCYQLATSVVGKESRGEDCSPFAFNLVGT